MKYKICWKLNYFFFHCNSYKWNRIEILPDYYIELNFEFDFRPSWEDYMFLSKEFYSNKRSYYFDLRMRKKNYYEKIIAFIEWQLFFNSIKKRLFHTNKRELISKWFCFIFSKNNWWFDGNVFFSYWFN